MTPSQPPAGSRSFRAARIMLPWTVSLAGLRRRGVAWRIHRERVLLGRLGSGHPAPARPPAGRARRGRAQRLHHRALGAARGACTARSCAMLALTFGPDGGRGRGRPDQRHPRPRPRPPRGPGRRARPYSAHDPELLAWVHATLLDSFLGTYRLFVGPAHDRRTRTATARRRARSRPALGIPPGRLPRTEATLRDYLEAMLAGGRHRGDRHRPRGSRARVSAAGAGSAAAGPPARRAARGRAPASGHPGRLRPSVGRPPRAGAGVLAAVRRRGLPLVPPALRYWAVARRAERRPRR